MSRNIPCTVAVLTRNSEATLARALESVKNFDELLICDGGSTDRTLAIAESFGARVIGQDKNFLAEDGRIQNFAGVRNQTLAAASHAWFFFLDSDEYVSPALAKELCAAVAADKPAAYWVPRKYVYRGKVVDRAVTYPNRQMRFFNRRTAASFIKAVHERIELLPGTPVKELAAYLLVPMEDSVADMKRKWRGYLEVEGLRSPVLTLRQWIVGALRESAVAGLYVARFARNIIFYPNSTRLPARFELARLWYQWEAILTSLSRVRSW